MSQTCKTCKRPDVAKINKLISNSVPTRDIANKFSGISKSAIDRHKTNCLKQLFAEVIVEKRAGLLAEVDKVKDRIAVVAEQFADNGPVQVQLIARSLDAIEKEAKLTGAYQQDRSNEEDVKLGILKSAIETRAKEKGVSFEEEAKRYISNYADTIKPEIKDKLVSELGTVG